MSFSEKVEHWAFSGLFGAVLAGLIFGESHADYGLRWLGALIMIVLLEPLRRWAVREKQKNEALYSQSQNPK